MRIKTFFKTQILTFVPFKSENGKENIKSIYFSLQNAYALIFYKLHDIRNKGAVIVGTLTTHIMYSVVWLKEMVTLYILFQYF